MSYADYDAPEAYEDDLSDVLVGRRIIDADTRNFTLELDDGTVLEFVSTADCCAFFDPDVLEWIDYDDNVITAVKQVETAADNDDYDILILSASKQIAKLGVVGSEGNGYYVHHVGMRVHKP